MTREIKVSTLERKYRFQHDVPHLCFICVGRQKRDDKSSEADGQFSHNALCLISCAVFWTDGSLQRTKRRTRVNKSQQSRGTWRNSSLSEDILPEEDEGCSLILTCQRHASNSLLERGFIQNLDLVLRSLGVCQCARSFTGARRVQPA